METMECAAAPRSSEEEGGEEEEADALTSWLRLTRAASTLLDRRRSAETYWAKRARPDGRLLLQCRPTSVETGVVEPSYRSLAATATAAATTTTTTTTDPYSPPASVVAAGSSLVRMGSTHVLAVVTLQVGYVVASGGGSGSASGSGRQGGGPQRPATMGGGDVVITCSHRNLIGSSTSSSSSVDPTLTSHLQRVVEENADLGQLYLPLKKQQQEQQRGASTAVVPSQTPPPQAFRLCVGVEVLADGGNVRDAALLACTAALADTCLPSAELDRPDSSDVDGSNPRVRLVLDAHEEPRRLSCPRLPVPLTLGVWEGGGGGDGRYQLIVDPTKEEQLALSGSITVVVDAAAEAAPDDDEACVLSCEMKGRTDLTTLALAVKLARGRANELLPVLRP